MSIDPNLNLVDAEAKVHTMINNFRDGMFNNYFTYNGNQWNCDDVSRQNIIGVIVMAMLNGGNLPPGFIFRDYNNVNHVITGAQIIGMGIKMLGFLSGVYQASWVHKANIEAMTDPIALQEYDFTSTLWPSPDV
jgi:hypothetical protein